MKNIYILFLLIIPISSNSKVSFGSCLNTVLKAIEKEELPRCFFESIETNQSAKERVYIQKSDLDSDELRLFNRWEGRLKSSRNKFKTAFKLLREMRLNPEKYSGKVQILLMREFGRNKKLTEAATTAGKLLNKMHLHSKRTASNRELKVGGAIKSIKSDLELMSTRLSRMKEQRSEIILGLTGHVMRGEDRAKAEDLIQKIDQIKRGLPKTHNPKKLMRYYEALEEVQKEYGEIDKNSLGAAEDFQRTVGSIKSGVDLAGALAQTAAVQIATLQGGTAGGAATAAGFCIFQKEYERYAAGKTINQQFHADVAKSCAIEGSVAGVASKLTVGAFDKIDAKIASKAYASTLKVISGSGINMASSVASTVLSNVFAKSAALVPDASICEVVAQTIKAEIDQFSTPKGLATLLLQNLMFKGLHQKSLSQKSSSKSVARMPAQPKSAEPLPKLRFTSLKDFHDSRKALIQAVQKKEVNDLEKKLTKVYWRE